MSRTITPRELNALRQKGGPIDLIDVRTPLEFREVHVDFAQNIPLDQLDPAQLMRDRSGGEERPLYVICRSGSRGQRACERLLAAGHGTVVNVEGGTAAWDAAGLPVIRGRTGMSLERQVRIATGLLVLAGTALGAFVHPGLLAIPAFVGTGLVVAGVTDWCGMGLLLARMPWNKVPIAAGGSCPDPAPAEPSHGESPASC